MLQGNKQAMVDNLQTIVNKLYSSKPIVDSYLYNEEKTWVCPVDKYGRQLTELKRIKLV